MSQRLVIQRGTGGGSQGKSPLLSIKMGVDPHTYNLSAKLGAGGRRQDA